METMRIEAEVARETVKQAAAMASSLGMTFEDFLGKALSHYTDINRYSDLGRDTPSITDAELEAKYSVVGVRGLRLYKLFAWMSPEYAASDKDGPRYRVYIYRHLAITAGSRPIGKDIPEARLASYEAEAEELETAEDKDRLLVRMTQELSGRSRTSRRK